MRPAGDFFFRLLRQEGSAASGVHAPSGMERERERLFCGMEYNDATQLIDDESEEDDDRLSGRLDCALTQARRQAAEPKSLC